MAKRSLSGWPPAAFFGLLLASGIFDVFGSVEWESYFGASIVAGITGGAVYVGERYNAAKQSQKVTPRLELGSDALGLTPCRSSDPTFPWPCPCPSRSSALGGSSRSLLADPDLVLPQLVAAEGSAEAVTGAVVVLEADVDEQVIERSPASRRRGLAGWR